MTRTLKKLLAVPTALVLLIVFTAGCSDRDPSASSTKSSSPGAGDGRPSKLDGEITVSAAASLTEAFTDIGEAFTSANPDADVKFNFDSSTALSIQIIEGAPADVFASANQENMVRLTDGGLIAGDPKVFVRNQLAIVVKPGNPAGVSGLEELADVGVISLCGEDVPCGKFAQEALDRAGVTLGEGNVTRGQNVKATLTAVSQGDAVAAIVYATDAAVAGDAVDVVTIPEAQNVLATYPIGVVESAPNSPVAEAFMAFVLGREGRTILADHGFLPPS